MAYKHILSIIEIFVILALPFAAIVWPRAPKILKSTLSRLFIVHIVGWSILVFTGWMRGYLWELELNQTGIIPQGDPAFGMSIRYIFGWVFILIGSLPSVLVYGVLAFRSLKARKDEQGAPSDCG